MKNISNTTISFSSPKSIFDVDFKIITHVRDSKEILPVEFKLYSEKNEPCFLKIQGHKPELKTTEFPIVSMFKELIGKRTLEDIDKHLGKVKIIEIVEPDNYG